jgi:mutator protein MutT
MFTIGAYAIIIDPEQRVLLCQRNDIDRWNLPGGGVESGETPWEAVVREVREEVGLIVTIKRLLGVYAYPTANDVIFSFLCERVTGEPTLSDEARAIDYFQPDQLPENTHLHHAIRIRDFFQRSEDICLDILPVLPHTEFGGKNSN